MTFIEFFAGATIAIYAMVGGAFINAAITAPSNMLKVLSAGWDTIFGFLIYGITGLICGAIAHVIAIPNEAFFSNPFVWLAVAHFALYAVFYSCRRIVEIILIDTRDDDGGEKSDAVNMHQDP